MACHEVEKPTPPNKNSVGDSASNSSQSQSERFEIVKRLLWLLHASLTVAAGIFYANVYPNRKGHNRVLAMQAAGLGQWRGAYGFTEGCCVDLCSGADLLLIRELE